MTLLLRNGRLPGGDSPVDIEIDAGRIVAIGAGGHGTGVDLDGRYVVPGLWDHHVHFDQWTLTRQRLDLSDTTSAADAVHRVIQRLRTKPPERDLPLIGYGFRDGLWPDRPHRDLLDAVSTDTPLVMVSGDLHCGWLNSVAAQRYGHAEHPTGILRESEWLPIMHELRVVPDNILDQWVTEAVDAAARRGVVGVVDFESPWSLDAWVRRTAAGVRLRVRCGVWPEKLDEAIARGLRTGDRQGTVEMGPLKVIIDGSLNTRTAYCHDPYPEGGYGILAVPTDRLHQLMSRAWSHGIETAIHAIGDHANTIVLDAFEAVGSAGTVEHAQLLTRLDIKRFAALKVAASVQPEHAMDDRDVADRYWSGRTDRAFANRDLLDAGARLLLGSDAPVAPLDPWVSIAAAVDRSRDGRAPWHPEQRIPRAFALRASAQTTIAVGQPADLAIVERDPYADELRDMPVAGTLLGGAWTYRSDSIG